MTPERWQEIERLYHAALERDGDQRAVFLAVACRDDDELRREVESLFAYQARAADFLETPAARGHVAPIASVLRRHEVSVPGRFVGRAFGVYELKTLIAAGGMGEVYRAVDTRLDRTVAIKTLHRANDPDQRERFKREAKTVSSLNHPHICTLYDVGTEDGVDYLVMEHIEGETLETRLERGALPLSQAIQHAIQMCEALDKAHRQGIVHRDLKPANVMLTKAGVKLLDFGLAAGTMAAGEASVENGGAHQTDAPRVQSALREQSAPPVHSTLMGTLAYVAPERLEGKPADARTDLFAFGAIVYEMVSGKRAFQATSQQGLLEVIEKADPPPLDEVVPHVPPPLARTVARCLAKDRQERWQTASDLLFQLCSLAAASPTVVGKPLPSRRLSVERLAWTGVVLAAIIVTLLWARGRDMRPGDPLVGGVPISSSLLPPKGTAFYSDYDVPLALSPDGRHIVYVAASADGNRRLWLRSLYSGLEQPMPGTEAATTPFWSPDGQWIGFFANKTLKKIRVSSGITQIIATDVVTHAGAAWSVDDVILFPDTHGGLSRVSAQGGAVSRATTGRGHFWPQFLRDGKHFIYSAAPKAIRVNSLETQAARTLMTLPVHVSALTYAPGYVLFVQDGALFARPFDDQRLEFTGEPVRILDGVPVTAAGRAPVSVSSAGVLAYWPYPTNGTPARLQWFARDGRTSPAVETPAQYVGFALSPDGNRLAFSRTARNGHRDVWIRDLADGTEIQVTFDGHAYTPRWSPDGARLAFSGPGQHPPPKLFIKDVGSPGVPAPFAQSPDANFASSWSRDGRSLVSVRIDAVNRNDLWIQRLPDGAGERLAFNTPFNESRGTVSPDNRWIAYDTDESGKDEVWAASFPSGEVRRRVSVAGGTSPQWGRDGTEIVYVSDDKQMMAVPVRFRNTGVDVGQPRALFRVSNITEVPRRLVPTANTYVAAANGQRFLVAVRAPDPSAPPITLVVNWTALLKR